MYKVLIIQEDNTIRFEFNRLTDAVAFVSECLEVGDLGTEACIKSVKEEE